MKRYAHDILIKPLMTEKQMASQEDANRYYFQVAKDATKTQIKAIVEKTFDVKVVKVNTMLMPGKWKRVGKSFGRRPNWKKAAITLREGDVISMFEGV
jgi:large subunit ribosomal protein L23